jgi:hypothetical protein
MRTSPEGALLLQMQAFRSRRFALNCAGFTRVWAQIGTCAQTELQQQSPDPLVRRSPLARSHDHGVVSSGGHRAMYSGHSSPPGGLPGCRAVAPGQLATPFAPRAITREHLVVASASHRTAGPVWVPTKGVSFPTTGWHWIARRSEATRRPDRSSVSWLGRWRAFGQRQVGRNTSADNRIRGLGHWP